MALSAEEAASLRNSPASKSHVWRRRNASQSYITAVNRLLEHFKMRRNLLWAGRDHRVKSPEAIVAPRWLCLAPSNRAFDTTVVYPKNRSQLFVRDSGERLDICCSLEWQCFCNIEQGRERRRSWRIRWRTMSGRGEVPTGSHLSLRTRLPVGTSTGLGLGLLDSKRHTRRTHLKAQTQAC